MDSNPKIPLSDGSFMPLLGVGMNNFRPNDKTFNLNDFVMKAANVGYTHFDVVNNEQAIGDALKLVFDSKRQCEDEEGEKIPDQFEQAFPREKMFITYKVYNTHDIEKNVKNALTSTPPSTQP
jgi:diketogulonate reductase-like aldo/keto reductase